MNNKHFNADRCSSNEFSCWIGTCIPSSEHCDGIRNCVDDSDEIECSKRFWCKKAWSPSADEQSCTLWQQCPATYAKKRLCSKTEDFSIVYGISMLNRSLIHREKWQLTTHLMKFCIEQLPSQHFPLGPGQSNKLHVIEQWQRVSDKQVSASHIQGNRKWHRRCCSKLPTLRFIRYAFSEKWPQCKLQIFIYSVDFSFIFAWNGCSFYKKDVITTQFSDVTQVHWVKKIRPYTFH